MAEPDIDGIEIEGRESGGFVVTVQIWPDRLATRRAHALKSDQLADEDQPSNSEPQVVV